MCACVCVYLWFELEFLVIIFEKSLRNVGPRKMKFCVQLMTKKGKIVLITVISGKLKNSSSQIV